MSKRKIWWAASAAYMGFIFYLSSQSSIPGTNALFPFYDKIMHIALFSILSLLFRKAWGCERVKLPHLLAFICTAIYGASDEFHQSFIHGRTMELYDFFADAIGGLAAIVWKKRTETPRIRLPTRSRTP